MQIVPQVCQDVSLCLQFGLVDANLGRPKPDSDRWPARTAKLAEIAAAAV